MANFFHALTKTVEFWVVLPFVMVIAPHLPRLAPWMLLLLFIIISWRLLSIKRPEYLPGKLILLTITLLTTLGILFQYKTLMGKTAGTAFLIILLCIKLMESKKPRDYILVITLSFFIMVTNFFFSQSIPTVIFMFITVIMLIMGLCMLHQKADATGIKRSLIFSSRITLQALPLMLILFVLFPRIPGPLWALPDEKHTGRTGLSDTMSPGNISKLIQSNAVAFRVNFNGQIPPQNLLYWRGLVLWAFDGRSWTPMTTNNSNQQAVIEVLGSAIEYTVTLEPHDKKWLFALDIPSHIPASSRFNNDYLIRSEKTINTLHQYTLKSTTDYRIGKNLSSWEKNAGLYLDRYKNPRTIALGELWKQQFTTPQDIINRALSLFNQQNFIYSLEPPVTPGADPVDQFLFNTRKGFCEHYASSFTVLMRAAGIPARVVLGYQGGTINPLNNILTVRQSDAHAWTEVWLQDRGWIRVDPTAAIAPERIELNLDSALADTDARPLHMQLNTGLIRQFGFYWDAIDNRWNQWVIGYGEKLQHKLLSSLLQRDIDSTGLIKLLVIALVSSSIVIFVLILRSSHRAPLSLAETLYERFCKKCADVGIQRHQYEGPLDFADRVIERLPQQADLIHQITRIYINSKYRSAEKIQHLSAMKAMIRRMKTR